MSTGFAVDMRYDVLIVGAGVIGALVAYRLAEAGLSVLVLEAGPERADRTTLVEAFARSNERAPNDPYDDPVADAHAPSPKVSDKAPFGHYIQGGPDPFKSTYPRLVGGSTWHWLGNTPRFLPTDFRICSTYGVGVDWLLSYGDLEPWYCQAEVELGVSGDHTEWQDVLGAHRTSPFPMPPIWRAYGDEVVAKAIDGQEIEGQRLKLRITPQARNSVTYQGRPPCAGNSSCVPICPIGAKYDATVHVQMARNPKADGSTPAEFVDRAVVKRLEKDELGRVTRAIFDRWSIDGTQRVEASASARVFVLAAHAIESPLILLQSDLAKLGPVGRNLMDHLQGYGGAILPDQVFPFRGPPVTSGFDEFRDGSFRATRAAFRISVGNDGWGRMESLEETLRHRLFVEKLHGRALRDSVNARATRMLRMSYSTEMLPDADNSVSLGDLDAKGNVRPKISFRLPEYNKRTFAFANRVFAAMFHRLGGTDVRYSHSDAKPSFSGAGHIIGTCRMGRAANDSVVDADCRAHEHPNLFVLGASIFPTSGTANPTLTAAALALRAAQLIQLDINRHP